jgi:two-component system response regulator AtoC
LAKNFLDEFRKEFSKDISGFREDTIKIIENYDFPGNVRELRNIIERATLLESSNLIRPASLPEELKISSNLKESSLIFNDDVPWRSENFSFKEYIDSVEKRIVQEVLKETDNKKSKAAQMLGLTRFALRHQLKKHGIEDDDS